MAVIRMKTDSLYIGGVQFYSIFHLIMHIQSLEVIEQMGNENKTITRRLPVLDQRSSVLTGGIVEANSFRKYLFYTVNRGTIGVKYLEFQEGSL